LFYVGGQPGRPGALYNVLGVCFLTDGVASLVCNSDLKAADVADRLRPDDTPPYQDGENVDGFDYSLVPQDGESFGPYAGAWNNCMSFDVHVLHWPYDKAWKQCAESIDPEHLPDIDNVGHVRPPSQKM